MDMKELYEDEVSLRLKGLDAQMQEIAERVDSASADIQAEVSERLQTLKTQRNELQDQFVELQEASDAAWNELRNGFDTALTEFTDALIGAHTQFEIEGEQQIA